MKRRAVLEVDLNLLKQNSLVLKNLAGHSFFCPMIKADAYGHGAVSVAKALFEVGIKQVGVINTSEAWPIKEMVENMDILIFGPVLNKEDLSWIVEEQLVLVCSNWEDLKALSQYKQPSRIHLKFDTGFSRLGFDLNSTKKLFNFLKDYPQIQLEGLATQLVSGEELGSEKNFSSNQIKHFVELKKIFSCQNFHALNTSALVTSFAYGKKFLCGARPGIGLYGVKPEVLFANNKSEKKWEKLSLFPVSSLRSYVVAVHQLKKGDFVSYGGTWKAPCPSRIATVSLGYGDGFLRSFGSTGKVLLRGKKRSVVGAVCMDFFMIDVTDVDKGGGDPVQIGEEVIIFGKQQDVFLSPQDQAECAGTISYELFSRLGPRIERIYKS